MSAQPAARVEDPIAHTQARKGMMLGILAGVVVGAVVVGATIATGGAALAVAAAVGGAAGLTSFGGLSGMNIGAATMGPPTGQLRIGSPNVFINGRPATMTAIATGLCSHHAGPIPLATGSSTVFINGRMAGREGETMGCSAVVVAMCSPDVLIGGGSAPDPAVRIKPEVAPRAVDALVALGIAGGIMALPFAIATVGVAATIGAGVAGYLGSELAGKGMRALGEAMGMSEADMRAMEAGGQFFGGMAGGFVGMKGAGWTGNRVLPRATTPMGVLLRQGQTGGNPEAVAAMNRMPEPFRQQYAAARATGWKDPDGKWIYPPNNGGIGDPIDTRLPKNFALDRYGEPTGGYMSSAGDDFASRALPPDPTRGSPHLYAVDKPLRVEQSPLPRGLTSPVVARSIG